MTQNERLDFLLRYLLKERKEYAEYPCAGFPFRKAAASAQPDECAPALSRSAQNF